MTVKIKVSKKVKREFDRALALKHAGKLSEALECFENMGHLPAAQILESMYEKAHTLLLMGRAEESLEAVDRILKVSLGIDPEAWYLKSLAYEKLGNAAKAGKCWENSVREAKKIMESEHPCEFWEFQAFDLCEMGSWARSELCYDALIRLDPANLEAWHEKGNSLISMGRHKEALPLLEKALEMGPGDDDYPFVLLSKGCALGFLGRCDEALAVFDLALAAPQGNNFDRLGETWLERGGTLFRAGRFEEALESFRQAASFGYWHLPGVYWMAQALEKLGRCREALECCEELLKRHPKDKNVLKIRTRLMKKEGITM